VDFSNRTDTREGNRAPADTVRDEQQPGRLGRLARELIIELFSGNTLTLEVFTHHSFGERYLTPFRLVQGACVYGVYSLFFGGLDLIRFFFTPPERRTAPGTVIVLLLFFLAYLFLGVYHRFEVFYRNTYLTDEVPHTRFFGVIWPLLRLVGLPAAPLPPVDEWFLYRYVEPWAWFLFGGSLMFISTVAVDMPDSLPGVGAMRAVGAIGLWVVLASVALFVKNQAIYQQERGRELNLRDARIEAAARRLPAQGASMEAVGGYKVVTPLPRLPRAVDTNQDGIPDDDEAIMRRFLKSPGKEEVES
jgi:hypothetical protein